MESTQQIQQNSLANKILNNSIQATQNSYAKTNVYPADSVEFSNSNTETRKSWFSQNWGKVLIGSAALAGIIALIARGKASKASNEAGKIVNDTKKVSDNATENVVELISKQKEEIINEETINNAEKEVSKRKKPSKPKKTTETKKEVSKKQPVKEITADMIQKDPQVLHKVGSYDFRSPEEYENYLNKFETTVKDSDIDNVQKNYSLINSKARKKTAYSSEKFANKGNADKIKYLQEHVDGIDEELLKLIEDIPEAKQLINKVEDLLKDIIIEDPKRFTVDVKDFRKILVDETASLAESITMTPEENFINSLNEVGKFYERLYYKLGEQPEIKRAALTIFDTVENLISKGKKSNCKNRVSFKKRIISEIKEDKKALDKTLSQHQEDYYSQLFNNVKKAGGTIKAVNPDNATTEQLKEIADKIGIDIEFTFKSESKGFGRRNYTSDKDYENAYSEFKNKFGKKVNAEREDCLTKLGFKNGLTETGSEPKVEEVKKAYRKIANNCHSDKTAHMNLSEAELKRRTQLFIEANAAMEKLKDIM